MAEQTQENVAQTAARLAYVPEIHTVGDQQFIVTPPGYALRDFDHLLPAPRRIQARPSFNDPESFIKYVQEFTPATPAHGAEAPAFEGVQRFFGDFEKYRITAVLNDSARGRPQYGDHVAFLQMQQAREWILWTQQDGKMMSGSTLARFIENHLSEITGSFNGADLLQMCRGLRVKTDGETEVTEDVAEGRRVIGFKEETKVLGGTVPFPETFEVTLRVFMHVTPYKFTARLRWDKTDRGVMFFYDLVDQKMIEQEAFNAVREELGARLFADIYAGAPGGKE